MASRGSRAAAVRAAVGCCDRGRCMKFFRVLGWLAALVKIGFGIIFIRYWIRSRFWVPKYVHVMAAIALLIGLASLGSIPPEAPINRGASPFLNKVLAVLMFPALVYGAFVFYGGQHAAFDGREDRIPCPSCRASEGVRGTTCAACGQKIS